MIIRKPPFRLRGGGARYYDRPRLRTAKQRRERKVLGRCTTCGGVMDGKGIGRSIHDRRMPGTNGRQAGLSYAIVTVVFIRRIRWRRLSGIGQADPDPSARRRIDRIRWRKGDGWLRAGLTISFQ